MPPAKRNAALDAIQGETAKGATEAVAALRGSA